MTITTDHLADKNIEFIPAIARQLIIYGNDKYTSDFRYILFTSIGSVLVNIDILIG